jgi:hypothetical protein
MAEQPVNLSTVLYLGAFSRADQRLGRRELKRMAYLAVPAKPSRATHCLERTLPMLSKARQHAEPNTTMPDQLDQPRGTPARA